MKIAGSAWRVLNIRQKQFLTKRRECKKIINFAEQVGAFTRVYYRNTLNILSSEDI